MTSDLTMRESGTVDRLLRRGICGPGHQVGPAACTFRSTDPSTPCIVGREGGRQMERRVPRDGVALGSGANEPPAAEATLAAS